MRASLMVAASLMLSCAVLQGAEHGFDAIVRAVSAQLHTGPTHIPLFGLVNFATFVAHPAGVKHLNITVFENLDLDDHAARDLAEAIQSVDDGWRPFVRVVGHAETVLVFMTQDRGDCKLLVAAIETGEITIVELKLNPEALQAWLREPEASAVRNVSQ
jgi:hypothetical protein